MQENCKKDKIDWYYLGEYYTYGKGKHTLCSANKPDSIPIYTESEFEALLKAEQENEATQTFGGMTSTGENAQTFPKNTVFGKEGIALKPSFEPKGDGNVALDKNATAPSPYDTQGYLLNQAKAFAPISEMKDPVKSTESNQVTFTYQTAIDLLAYYTKIDKGIIKIEMP